MTDINNRPMLAYTGTEEIFKKLYAREKAGLLASFKLDGIRCRILDGLTISRSGKVLPNMHIRHTLYSAGRLLDYMDGELIIVGESNNIHDLGSFQATDSGVMSEGGRPNYIYAVFDTCDPRTAHLPFTERQRRVEEQIYRAHTSGFTQITFWGSEWCRTYDDLLEYEAAALRGPFEGLIVRTASGRYKYGRSSGKTDCEMGKLKRFEDAEAVILEIHPLEHNNNEQQTTELGYAKRSSHKANQVISDELMGAMTVQDVKTQVVFRIGSGPDWDLRAKIWRQRTQLIGKLITYKFQPHGVLHKPRSPVFKAFRNPIDL